MTQTTPHRRVIRQPAEQLYAQELLALAEFDREKRPQGWNLSPRAVKKFIAGTEGKPLDGSKKKGLEIRRKFYGDDTLLDRCIVTLLSNRGLMLVGEPGTAKSMLSELLSAAISGRSTLTVQGTAGTTEDSIKYSWNYALLLAEGPTPRALVPSPIFTALKQGSLARVEEITRCQPEIQDVLISILSEKSLMVPELTGEDGMVSASEGFNIIATANLRDRGVHEMSSALKRRFNFETVPPLNDKDLEMRLVREQTEALLRDANMEMECPPDVIDVLISTFQDLRTGRTAEGTVIEKPSTVMSTAEAVAVGFSSALDAHYFGEGKLKGENIARQILGTALKDNPDDAKKLRHYFEVVVRIRAEKSKAWKSLWEGRGHVGL
jgi:MoxR-like ATPase